MTFTSSTFRQRLDRKLLNAPGDVMNFIEACTMGNVDRLKELIAKGVDVNLPGNNGATGLMIAAMSDQTEILEELLDLQETEVNKQGLQGTNALMYAVIQGCVNAVQMLVEAGTSLSTTNTAGKSVIGLAADHLEMKEFLEVSGLLIQAGCHVTPKDWQVLTKYNQKKLYVQMELLRTQQTRFSLRFLAREAVIGWIEKLNCVQNPGHFISNLDIPLSLKHYIRFPR